MYTDDQVAAPFEGPEKLLELWFAPSPSALHGQGLRTVDRKFWEEMLDIVKCKILSVVHGCEMDAYLLSESSLFIAPHRLILKTCGTTLNLLGLPRILDIAAMHANLPNVYRCFYSRKSFMFPDRQRGPHRDWKQEVEFLDGLFSDSAAYTVGKVNGDHWLLYLTNPLIRPSDPVPKPPIPVHHQNDSDSTIEILMSDLSPTAREAFIFPLHDDASSPSTCAQLISDRIGISNIFPPHSTTLDAYAFTPCGYSANALIRWGDLPSAASLPNSFKKTRSDEGYYTIHVTPEPGWSYASFECNVPLPTSSPPSLDSPHSLDLMSLVKRVVSIFRPARLTVTLFISRRDNGDPAISQEDTYGASPVDAAQRAFRLALTSEASSASLGGRTYRRTDKINYEFGGYDLAFSSFELRS